MLQGDGDALNALRHIRQRMDLRLETACRNKCVDSLANQQTGNINGGADAWCCLNSVRGAFWLWR